MIDFEVYVDSYDHYPFCSKVYAIEPLGKTFLVATDDGYFHWVDTKDCKLVKEKEK